MDRYWNRDIETLDRDQIYKLQLERLRPTVKKVYENVPFYREKLDHIGITPDDIKTLEDLRHLPFTTKLDIRDSSPFGMLATPVEDLVRIHASSGGSTEKQIILGYTRSDVDTLTDCVARCYTMADMDKNSRVQISVSYALHTGGLAAHYGAEKLGSLAIPISGGNTRRQVNMMIKLGVTHLFSTPSYALHIADVMEEMGFTKEDIKLKACLCGAEPWSIEMRKEIESRLGVIAYDNYGACEIMGPCVSQDCYYQGGLHIWEDIFIPEIIDPITEKPLGEGEKGELVITTIKKEGLPLLRFRTRDITSLSYERCACGRTHARMSRLSGRTDDALSIRGVRVFPSQVELALVGSGLSRPQFQLIVDRVNNMDRLTVKTEIEEGMFSDYDKDYEYIRHKLCRRLEDALMVKAQILFVEPNSLKRDDRGKAVRVIDSRQLNQST